MCVYGHVCENVFAKLWVYPRDTCNIVTQSLFLNSHYKASLMYMVYCVAFLFDEITVRVT